MRLADRPRPRPAENLLPMINVVFLLLVFFLISARLTPPEPFAVRPPQAQAPSGAEAAGALVLYLAEDGRVGFAENIGADALRALAAARAALCAKTDCDAVPPHLMLRADAAVSAVRVSALVPQLAAMGFERIDLVALAGAGG